VKISIHTGRQSAGSSDEVTPVLELSDKDFKVAIIKMLGQAITNSLETNIKIERLSKEIGGIKENQIETADTKNTITEIFKKLARWTQ